MNNRWGYWIFLDQVNYLTIKSHKLKLSSLRSFRSLQVSVSRSLCQPCDWEKEKSVLSFCHQRDAFRLTWCNCRQLKQSSYCSAVMVVCGVVGCIMTTCTYAHTHTDAHAHLRRDRYVDSFETNALAQRRSPMYTNMHADMQKQRIWTLTYCMCAHIHTGIHSQLLFAATQDYISRCLS